jgi:hypothetical protein
VLPGESLPPLCHRNPSCSLSDGVDRLPSPV